MSGEKKGKIQVTEMPHIREILTAEMAWQAVRENARLAPVNPEYTCIDGRSQAENATALAGGLAGVLGVWLRLRQQLGQTGADISQIKRTDGIHLIISASGHEDTPALLVGHTDEYAHNDGVSVAGCGHCAGLASVQFSTDYGLTSEDATWLQHEGYKQITHGRRVAKFPGQHKEGTVIILEGPARATMPHNFHISGRPLQSFIYTKTLTHEYLDRLAVVISTYLQQHHMTLPPEIDLAETLKQISEQQLTATVKRIAKDDQGVPLPIYRFTITSTLDSPQALTVSPAG